MVDFVLSCEPHQIPIFDVFNYIHIDKYSVDLILELQKNNVVIPGIERYTSWINDLIESRKLLKQIIVKELSIKAT